MKLQDAFAAERNAAGGWKMIGYTDPSSNNFNYKGEVKQDATLTLDDLSSDVGWQAQNKVALNDCEKEKCFWDVAINKGSAGGQIEYAACNTSNASPLTANFTSISTPGKTCTVKTSAVSESKGK